VPSGAIIGDFDMTTHILPPERWAMDPGPHAGLVSAYADEIGGVGYDSYAVNCLVAAARHLCAWAHLGGQTARHARRQGTPLIMRNGNPEKPKRRNPRRPQLRITIGSAYYRLC
jgi:hypothetical protein